MHFEHLIEINDPRLPLLNPLSAAQLWRGLERRAREPLAFLPHFDDCRLLESGAEFFRHALSFGRHSHIEEVRLDAPHTIRCRVIGEDRHAGSELCMRIEEPTAGALFLRFRYDTVIVDAGDCGEQFDQTRRAAYLAADIDTVRRIRALAADGALG